MSHHDHDDDHDHDHDHDDDHDHDEHDIREDFHLDIHRAVDELGKYAIDMEIRSEKGVQKDTMKKFIAELMDNIMKSCFKHGADLVGHLKSIVLTKDGNIMSSIVDEITPVRIKDSLDNDKIYEATFTMHVIVHGIWDDEVRECTLDVLDPTFKKWNVPYRIIADYYDVEKSIAHHL